MVAKLAHRNKGSAGRTVAYSVLILLKNRKLVTICRINGGMVRLSVMRYIQLTALAVFGLKRVLVSTKNGLILIHATTL